MNLNQTGKYIITQACEGADAKYIAELIEKNSDKSFLYIVQDDSHMNRLKNILSFFIPDIDVLEFPAWDCLPYDRISPNAILVSKRMHVLSKLAMQTNERVVVIATVNAVSQYIMPKDRLAGAFIHLKVGGVVDLVQIEKFLVKFGYLRVDVVREPGEFAVRGGIIDFYPPGVDYPLRLDLFGDEVDSIRRFDPTDQITVDKLEEFILFPFHEIRLGPIAIQSFKTHYVQEFGSKAAKDPLYEAISSGSKYPGMEHWLPLFYEKLDTFFDFLPDNLVISYFQDLDQTLEERWEAIHDYYQTRVKTEEKQSLQGTIYRPLEPDQLYIMRSIWERKLESYPKIIYSKYHHLPTENNTLNSSLIPPFYSLKKKNKSDIYKDIKNYILQKQKEKSRIVVSAYSPGSQERLISLMQEYDFKNIQKVSSWSEAKRWPKNFVNVTVCAFEKGFSSPDLTYLTEQDILGDRLVRSAKKSRKAESLIQEMSQLQSGDFVVHNEHGIGQYKSLETIEVDKTYHDFIFLIYSGGDKLFVPVENLDLLTRYGSKDMDVVLDKLGSVNWQARKSKVKERIKDLADKLIKIAAARELQKAEAISLSEGEYEEFCSRFPYPETDDQLKVTSEILEDLSSGIVMDRLVCGDVGFGKTEVALRAAFVVAMTGKQVAVLVPTTLLCRQHYHNFKKRMEGFPIKTVQLSRFESQTQLKKNKEMIENGQADIVVGTHALLAKSISFSDLGLIIVDEEQHFGVVQKEKLKKLQTESHLLTLTATPIPRTMQQAMSGIRKMSIMATPPVDRLAIRTFILPFDSMVVREAILREKHRNGQVFYVCPRVKDLEDVFNELRELVPEVKVGMASGQISPKELEDIICSFYEGEFDVLLSTNIVESGLDLPRANTIIIHRSDMFGLAQLYQLRGRVGRSKIRAYAYLTIPAKKTISKTAQQRLEVMATLDTLGAGFTLASHDMDIRGAGNLLGQEQSGHIREVGIELYQKMLEEAVAEAKSTDYEETKSEWSPQLKLGISVLIPESYVKDLGVRLSLYKRLSMIKAGDEIDIFMAELIDRFGKIPEEVENLLKVTTLKELCRQSNVEKIDVGPKGAVFSFKNNSFSNPAKLLEYIAKNSDQLKIRPDQTLLYMKKWSGPKEKLSVLKTITENLVQCSQPTDNLEMKVKLN